MTKQQERLDKRVDFLDVIQQTLWDMRIKKRSIEIAQEIKEKVFNISEYHINIEKDKAYRKGAEHLLKKIKGRSQFMGNFPGDINGTQAVTLEDIELAWGEMK